MLSCQDRTQTSVCAYWCVADSALVSVARSRRTLAMISSAVLVQTDEGVGVIVPVLGPQLDGFDESTDTGEAAPA